MGNAECTRSTAATKAILVLGLAMRIARGQASTAVVTATTTHTVSDGGACNNFVGACVVYATGDAAPSTTTVDAGQTAAISTTTRPASTPDTTGDGASACAGFTGACVVYGGSGEALHTTTRSEGASHGGHTQQGNGDGHIAATKGGGGYIGQGVSLNMGLVVPLISFVLVNMGFVVLL